MLRRRDLAGATMRMYPRELLVGDGDHVASRTDGTATMPRPRDTGPRGDVADADVRGRWPTD